MSSEAEIVTEPPVGATETVPPTGKPASAGGLVLRDDTDGGRALADFRTRAMAAPVEVMQLALAEYTARRDYVRHWLLSQMTEGIHYGVPPGCEAKTRSELPGQKPGIYYQNGREWYHESQWKPKPSLYKAGADLVCDLFKVRPRYQPDERMWAQGGSRPCTFYFLCELVSESGTVIGEGRGAAKTGDRQNENAAVKKAQKCAKVDAVINAYGLSDLFAQDLEDGGGLDLHENPAEDETAPKVETRADRPKAVTREEFNEVFTAWLSGQSSEDKNVNKKNWQAMSYKVTGESFPAHRFDSWNRDRLDKVKRHLKLI